MSTLTADPGFSRGKVLGVTYKMYDAEPADGSNMVGVRKTFRDENPITGAVNSNHTVDCIAVRNAHSATLTPGQVVALDATLTQVSGLAIDTSTAYGVVDEYLNSTSAVVGEVLWVVVKGPSVPKKTTGTGTAITAGAKVSTTSTGGSLAAGTTAPIGLAMAAATTTDSTVRVYVTTPLG
jgi:hypothetical protein